MRVPKANFYRKIEEPGGRIQNKIYPSLRQEIILPNVTKNRPFLYWKPPNDRICHILSSRVDYSEHIGFDSDGSTVIVDNSENSHVYSEEYMLLENIDPIIYIGVANKDGNILLQKGFTQLAGTGLLMREKYTQRNWIMYSNFQTHQSIR